MIDSGWECRLSKPDEADIKACNPVDQEYLRLYGEYLDKIYRFIYRHVDDAQLAEDLTQLTFLKTYEALTNYRDRNILHKGWLFQVAKRAALDELKRVRYEREVPLREDLAETLVEEPCIGKYPEMTSEYLEQSHELAEAVSGLSRDQQELVQKKYVEDLKPEEIAQEMDINNLAINSLHYRAVQRLRAVAKEGKLAA